jgi:hypothetical protein
MNNPLDRRMFNQQMMNRQPMPNQPSMGRQSMGILASSPQLMNAVQGYAQGGQVVSAKDGKFLGFNNFVGEYLDGKRAENERNNTPEAISYQAQEKAAELNRTLPKGGFNNPNIKMYSGRISGILAANPNIQYDEETGYFRSNVDSPEVERLVKEKEKTDIEGDTTLLNELEKDKEKNKKTANQNMTQVEDLSGNKAATYDIAGGNDVAQTGLADNQIMDDGAGPSINAQLQQNLNKKKVVDEEDNGAPTTTAADITTKAANSLEAWKKKQKNIDKSYEVTNKNSEAMYKEVQKVLEETDDDIDLEAVERMAKKALGLKDGKEYDEDKTTAFWMAVIKGGLATAAGESANALTNIAKGLSFGVDSYGKDMNSIADDEREDRKDLAKMKYELIKDEKSARIAKRTLKLQGYQALAAIENRKNEFASTQDYQKQRDVITDAIANANLDLVAAQTFHKIGMDGADYDLNLKKFALDVKKQKQYIKLNNDKLNQDYKLGTMTPEMKNIYSLGDSYVSFDKDSQTFTYTPLGEQALIAATVTKTTMTDLKATAASIGETKKLRGLDYPTKEATVSAYYRYEGVIKPKLEALSKTSVDRTGQIDIKVYEAAEKEIMKQFAIDSGALNSQNTAPPPRNVAPTIYTSNPSDAEIKELVKQGFNSIKVGKNTFNIDPK